MIVHYNEIVRQTAKIGGIKVCIPRDEVENDEVYTGSGRMPAKYITSNGAAELVIGVDGKIIGWPADCTLDAMYKCVDSGHYWMLDERFMPFGRALIGEYVPDCLNFDGHSYGDYVHLKVDSGGNVEGFHRSFTVKHVAEFLSDVE